MHRPEYVGLGVPSLFGNMRANCRIHRKAWRAGMAGWAFRVSTTRAFTEPHGSARSWGETTVRETAASVMKRRTTASGRFLDFRLPAFHPNRSFKGKESKTKQKLGWERGERTIQGGFFLALKMATSHGLQHNLGHNWYQLRGY